MKEQTRTIIVPIHPDEVHIPTSIINLPLASGKIVTITGPIAPKTMGMLHDTIMICKDAIVIKEAQPDYSI